ncbi:MAG: EAL domain-containing protein [Blastocatellia bacterium]|nr:EAL domain-containing protein [Blastocatellia bacterium]
MIDTLNGLEVSKARILIIDDEALVRNVLFEFLKDDYACSTAASGIEVMDLIRKESFDVVLSDIDLGDINGIDMVPRILDACPDAAVVMISGNQTIDHAIEAMRVGAFDYIKKPFELDFVEVAVRRAVVHHHLLSERRRHETQLESLVVERTEQLNHIAFHDGLTGLPNRALFQDRLAQAVLTADGNKKAAVLYLQLEGFTKVQDTFGHAVADATLIEIANRLQEVVDARVTISRFEADEFVMIYTIHHNDQELVDISKKIIKSLNRPVQVEDQEVFVTPSVGISVFPSDGTDSGTLLRNARAALSKARGRNGDSVAFYTADINDRAIKRLTLEANLWRALEREEFEVYFQPKVDLNTRKIIGSEALVRWQHPEFGLISPADFIPSAEETGLIVPLGEWVLREACRWTSAWRKAGHNLTVAVNLSLEQMQASDLAEKVKSVLGETGLPPSQLNLEITESCLMRDSTASIATLADLKKTGITISLDDFGTGYSSLGHLKSLPIDVLKIDRSFIRDVTTDPDEAALAMAMVTLAHNLRLRVVAEGVETEEQFKFLHLLRCDEAQGFLFSPPLPPDEFISLVSIAPN